MEFQQSEVENMELEKLFKGTYFQKKVLITGHTGFKGSWLTYWLIQMGAKVYGISNEPVSDPLHFNLLSPLCQNFTIDINNSIAIEKTIQEIKPDIVFHLAAQALVRPSYENPLETLQTNIIGTASIFEACRKTSSIKAIVNVTSDKCYENKENDQAYAESDAMGGFDPYSVSKGCAELVTASYRSSFLNSTSKTSPCLLASGRAGNVIGGGDWAKDRLIPDMVRAISKKETVTIRYPKATRPWQHVLEPLSGYLLLGQKLLNGETDYAEGWNFGPLANASISVEEIVRTTKSIWPDLDYTIENKEQPHEARFLRLDCSKANNKLNWLPVWDHQETLLHTIGWYKNYYLKGEINTHSNLLQYISDAGQKNLIWTK